MRGDCGVYSCPMSLPLYQVDAFTSEPFAGNPAAVCLLDRDASVEWMQRVAREMNLSETAFIVGRDDGVYGLRWFTPCTEVALCGHATLAAAHVLWESGALAAAEAARFDTLSGRLTATRVEAGVRLDFPAVRLEVCAAPEGMLEALGVVARTVATDGTDYMVELDGEAAVRDAAPDHRALSRVRARAVCATARGTRCDFVSRLFAPGSGIDEDPVTGSSHCYLGPFWGERLGLSVLRARQLSARGGELGVELSGERVGLVGQAVTVLRGELLA